MIATGTEKMLPEGFEVPFARTAGYFGMRYRGCAYLYTGTDPARRRDTEVALARFGEHRDRLTISPAQDHCRVLNTT